MKMPVATGYGKPTWLGDQYFRTSQTTGKGYTSPDGATWTELSGTFDTYLEPRVFSGAKLVMYSTKGDAASVVLITRRRSSRRTRPTLASVVQSEVVQSCLLTAADIDVSALTQSVRGYRIAGITAIRSALEGCAVPGRSTSQHGHRSVCKPRGGASVATIPAADLDARAAGDAPGVSITLRARDGFIASRAGSASRFSIASASTTPTSRATSARRPRASTSPRLTSRWRSTAARRRGSHRLCLTSTGWSATTSPSCCRRPMARWNPATSSPSTPTPRYTPA